MTAWTTCSPGRARLGTRCTGRRGGGRTQPQIRGSSSSDVSSAVVVAAVERTRRLPQQSTLDGGLRGAPPPLRRLSAVEPRHLAPLASPPHSPRAPRPAPAPASAPPPAHAPPHPTPTISVSSAPDDESPAGAGSPEERRSLAPSDEPSSVFASADATPTDPFKSLEERCALLEKTVSSPSCDNCRTDDSKVEVRVLSSDVSSSVCASEPRGEAAPSGVKSETENPDPPKTSVDDTVSVQITLSRQSSTIKEISPASSKDSSKIGDLPESIPSREAQAQGSRAGAVAPLAVCEDIGVDDDNVDKVPSPPLQRVSGESTAAPDSVANKPIAHKDESSSVSDSDIVKRDNKSDSGERKQRNDVCPWEDE